ncbi:MAG: mechanosensitive ion channel family protein [Planctomycetota bacterium]|jgi:small-conductance mechanosensitive channel|nr:mechanosensitive ion channel family protein [Planctomycetota bacterium]
MLQKITITDLIGEQLDRVTSNNFMQAFIVLLTTFVLAKLLNWTSSAILKRMAKKTSTDVDDRLLTEFEKPVTATLYLMGLFLTAKIMLTAEFLPRQVAPWLMTISLYYWAVFAFRSVNILLVVATKHPKKFHAFQSATYPLFDNVGKLAIIGGVIFVLIQVWNVDATGWLASAGILGVAVGFASKDTLSNLFAGVFILADSPYRVGDYVQLDSGERGEVSFIGLRSTRIITRDDIEVTVPNSVIGGGKIVNETGGSTRKMRVRIPVAVGYGSDIDKVEKLLIDAIKGDNVSHVSAFPTPRVRFRGFGASGLDFELLCWITSPQYRGLVKHELLTSIYLSFDENDIEIPYSKQDLYIKDWPETPLMGQ